MNATSRRNATERVIEEWEQLRCCFTDVARQYRRRDISQNELIQRLASIVSRQLDLIRRFERSHGDLDDTVVMP